MTLPGIQSALVLILVLALLILVLLILLVLILIAFCSFFIAYDPPCCGCGRVDSVPRFSGFILWAEKQGRQQPRQDGGGDASGSGLQATRENAQKALLVHRIPDALG